MAFKMKKPSLLKMVKKSSIEKNGGAKGLMTEESKDTQGPVKPVNRSVASDDRSQKAQEQIVRLEQNVEDLQYDIEEMEASDDQSRKGTATVIKLKNRLKSHQEKLKVLRG
tara:strand:- start:201 stop:533 length:333 start_codon:yes stop_codon:yes gene_type:complete